MAHVSIKYEDPSPTPIKSVTLVMTKKEAQALRTLVGNAVANSSTQTIFKAMCDAGINRD